MPALAVAEATDPTGCGDVYSAAFVVRFLESGEVVDATRVANNVAALKAATSSLGAIRSVLSAAAPDIEELQAESG